MSTNTSPDILRIFTDACDRLGVLCKSTKRNNIAVSRRPDVAFLDSCVGPKT